MGEKRFDRILSPDLISELYGDPHYYETFVKEWLGKDKDLLLSRLSLDSR